MSASPAKPCLGPTTSTAADCWPRRSPPATCAASRQSRSRSTRGRPAVDSKVSASASTVSAGDEDVPLSRIARADAPARPVEAFLTGVRAATSVAVDDSELPLRALVVCRGQAGQTTSSASYNSP